MTTAYAFWNNKGRVGKSFLCFVAACEYAQQHTNTDVYILDLCPQANVSEILLGGYSNHSNGKMPIDSLTRKTPRATVAGYLEARLNSPFRMIDDITPFLCHPRQFNTPLPPNLKLVCGDNLLEILAEAIRQTSQLAIPIDAWKQVLNWIKDLMDALCETSGDRDTLFLLDCNPSFSIYTQLGLVASDYLVVPFTADDCSLRGVENLVALLYGIGDSRTTMYARLNFAKRAHEEHVNVPKLHTFVSNRATMFKNKPNAEFVAMSKEIKQRMDDIHRTHRTVFSNPKTIPSQNFIDIPDYHNACVVATTTGTPLRHLKAGTHTIFAERVQINQSPLDNYRKALTEFVSCL